MTTKEVAFVLVMVLLFWLYKKYTKRQKFTYIDLYTFHAGLISKFKKVRPELNDEQVLVVAEALKDYFKICQMSGKEFVAMPSQLVDDLWHEFILFTRLYQKFCKVAFGHYLHHTPAEAMPSQSKASDGIQTTWKYACKLEGINPKDPERLPRLFALDGLYNIENGFHYARDCKNSNNGDYCASHIGCGSSCGSSCGTSDSSSCGSGCGGD